MAARRGRTGNFRQLGPEWQYVAPNGIVTRGDTVYIATADGIKVTWDDGATWRVVTDSPEVHVAPTDSVRFIVDPEVRYLPFNTNPELWIDPLPGTGLIAGQVWDANGQPVQQARIYGLAKPEPQETPFSFIETYGPRNHVDRSTTSISPLATCRRGSMFWESKSKGSGSTGACASSRGN